MRSALYLGRVLHQRTRPRAHRLDYRVFTLLLDLDELPALDARLRLFAHNRSAFFSFHDADHGDRQPDGLRGWIARSLAAVGLSLPGGRVEVLCYPRMFGFVFNPLTVFFCSDAAGQVRAILYEVANTHGERHTYVIPVTTGSGPVVRQSAPKRFFVSPFLDMDLTYDFAIGLPGDSVRIGVADRDAEGVVLAASFHGKRRELTDAALSRALLAYPLMTIKVVAGIHFEALKLWLKRVPVVPYAPAARRIDSTVIVARPTSEQPSLDSVD